MRRPPERPVNPPEPPKPVDNCWYCGEDLYPNYNNDIDFIAGEYPCCMSEDCIEAIALEEGVIDEYERWLEENEYADSTLFEYVYEAYHEYHHILTDREREEVRAEAKLEEEQLRRAGIYTDKRWEN